MGLSEAVEFYRPLFGMKGLALTSYARLRKCYPIVALRVDGIKTPMYVRWRTSDLSVFRQIYVLGEYDCDLPSEPSVIIDAGANIGLTSILYANRYPNAKILAIEPEGSNFEMLARNVQVYSRVQALRAALWSEDTDLQLTDPGLGHYGFRTSASVAGKAHGRVKACNISGLMTKFGMENIDLLKVDIEGAEVEVFENCKPWIEHVGTVVVETHDQFRRRSTEIVEEALVAFDIRWQIGETIYFTRSSLASGQFRAGSVTRPYRGHHIV
jgi:FkbM family methyltransferase